MKQAITLSCRGESIDYKWQIQPGASLDESYIEEVKSFLDLNASDPNGFQVLVHKKGNYFGVLLSENSARKDTRGRVIRISVLFAGIASESTARQLAIAALSPERSIVIREKLQKSIEYANSVEDPILHEYGWKADFDALSEVVTCDCVTGISLKGNDRFPTAWEKDNTRKSREKTAEELLNYSFTEEDGAKLIVTVSPSDRAYKKSQIEADRLLWVDADEKNLLRYRQNLRQQETEEEPEKTENGSKKNPRDRTNSPIPWTNQPKSPISWSCFRCLVARFYKWAIIQVFGSISQNSSALSFKSQNADLPESTDWNKPCLNSLTNSNKCCQTLPQQIPNPIPKKWILLIASAILILIISIFWIIIANLSGVFEKKKQESNSSGERIENRLVFDQVDFFNS